METHAHHLHNAPGNKFWHYFYEFLMLFLAVFCGFLAENLRENRVEHQRAKELAKNLYKEIYTDSVTVQQNLAIRRIKEEQATYFINYVRDSSLTNLSYRFYPAFTWAFIQSVSLLFEPNDGILNQLRNSGELRYFKSSSLQSKIGELTVTISRLRSRNEKEYSYIEFYLRPFTIKHFDFGWYEALIQGGKKTLISALNQEGPMPPPGRLINADQFSRQEAENITSYYRLMLRGTRQNYYSNYVVVNHELLELLRKEYSVE